MHQRDLDYLLIVAEGISWNALFCFQEVVEKLNVLADLDMSTKLSDLCG